MTDEEMDDKYVGPRTREELTAWDELFARTFATYAVGGMPLDRLARYADDALDVRRDRVAKVAELEGKLQ